MSSRRAVLSLFVAAIGVVTAHGTSGAEVPPNNSSVEPVVFGSASGIGSNDFYVRILDVNSVPQPNRLVTVDFSATSIRLYGSQNSGTTLNCARKQLSKLTDAAGYARFLPRFGGFVNSNQIEASVEGVVLALVRARSVDIDAQGGTVGLSDFAIFAAGFGAVQPHPETNYNESVSEIPDLGDFSVFSEHFASAVVGTYCP